MSERKLADRLHESGERENTAERERYRDRPDYITERAGKVR